MNILYITFVDVKNKESIGVEKKIIGQVKGIRSNGHNVSYTICENNDFVVFDENDNKEIICKFKNNKHKRLTMYNKNLLNLVKQKNIDVIYMRYAMSDILLIKFLANVKILVKEVYVEIPTYPYDKEINNKKLLIDKFFRKYLYKYVDKIIVSSCKVNKIYSIPTVFIDNCVDVEKITYKNHNYNRSSKEINLIAVSFIRYSNGYDRLIEGLRKYYLNFSNADKIIRLTFIGEGKEVERLKQMIYEYKLSEYIKFEGVKVGKELDLYFENADIAIGALGDHRVGILNKSPLKSREYCARGIPFISSIIDPGFKGEEDFILKVPSDDTRINMYSIIEFYESLSYKQDISKVMRKYAYNNFDWSNQYKAIF